MLAKILSYRSFVIFLSLVFLLLLLAYSLAFLVGCQKQSAPPVSKVEPPSAAETPQEPTQPSGHFHADGTWHEGAHEAGTLQSPVNNPAETQPEDLTPIPWSEAKQRLLERKAAAAERPPVPPAPTWEGRKQQVAADPDLIWQLNFVVPDVEPENHYPLGKLYDYRLTYEVDIPKNTESQRERLEPLESDWRDNDDPEEDKRLSREIVAIEVEGLDLLTAVKYIKSGLYEDEIAVEYAERAVRKTPTAEAYHVLAWVHWGVDDAAAEAALRQSLAIDPNYVRALRDLAVLLQDRKPSQAIGYIRKAAALDHHIPENNYLLGQCYERLGHYEKALEVYQATRALGMFSLLNITGIQRGFPETLPLGEE